MFLWKFVHSPFGEVFAVIHDRAPGLMIGLFEAVASFFLFSGGGLRTAVAIVLAVAGVFDIWQGVKHLLYSETDY